MIIRFNFKMQKSYESELMMEFHFMECYSKQIVPLKVLYFICMVMQDHFGCGAKLLQHTQRLITMYSCWTIEVMEKVKEKLPARIRCLMMLRLFIKTYCQDMMKTRLLY